MTLVSAYLDSDHHRLLSKTHLSLQRNIQDRKAGGITLFRRGSSKKSKTSKPGAKNAAQPEALTGTMSKLNLAPTSSPNRSGGVAPGSPNSSPGSSPVGYGTSPKSPQPQPGSAGSPSPLTSPRGPTILSPNSRRLEEAQANIARGRGSGASSPVNTSPAGSRSPSPPFKPRDPNQPMSPQSSAQESIFKVVATSLCRPPSPRTSEQTEHDTWLSQAKFSVLAAKSNQEATKAHRRSRGIPIQQAPPVDPALRHLRAEAKSSRANARTAAQVTASSLSRSRPFSPTTITHVTQSHTAGLRAAIVGETYWSAERELAQNTNDARNWRALPAHIEAAARSATRTDAITAYHSAQHAQYDAQVQKELAKGPHPGFTPAQRDLEKQVAIKGLVEGNKRFRDKAEIYYTREDWHRETRAAFPEGSSSEEEGREFEGWERGKRRVGGSGGGASGGASGSASGGASSSTSGGARSRNSGAGRKKP